VGVVEKSEGSYAKFSLDIQQVYVKASWALTEKELRGMRSFKYFRRKLYALLSILFCLLLAWES